jgi:hypothetical protein
MVPAPSTAARRTRRGDAAKDEAAKPEAEMTEAVVLMRTLPYCEFSPCGVIADTSYYAKTITAYADANGHVKAARKLHRSLKMAR